MTDIVYEGHPRVRRVSYRGEDDILPPRPLKPRWELRYHSPDGFAWGYEGSGPAQLALALCAHALEDDEKALRLYQTFKSEVVAKWPADKPWAITRGNVLGILRQIERDLPR